MTTPFNREKIVVFTGAGVSAESGLRTFRDSDGLWHNYSITEVATPEAWYRNPELVLDFYNQRRRQLAEVSPNPAHEAIVQLERRYEVVVVTQNIDDLHERAGGANVIHLHGKLTFAQSCDDPELLYKIGYKDIRIGDRCEKGSQLRPHVVWFGETVQNIEASTAHIETADKILVIGTSLSVFPAAGLLANSRHDAEKVINSLELDYVPEGYRYLKGKASEQVPPLVKDWLGE